jgi:hypothetical protein
MPTIAYMRADDGAELIGDLVVYENKNWLAPNWLAGPTANTRFPARIISLAGMILTKLEPGSQADLLLATPLSKSVLEGRAVAQNLDVRERPDIIRRLASDYLPDAPRAP